MIMIEHLKETNQTFFVFWGRQVRLCFCEKSRGMEFFHVMSFHRPEIKQWLPFMLKYSPLSCLMAKRLVDELCDLCDSALCGYICPKITLPPVELQVQLSYRDKSYLQMFNCTHKAGKQHTVTTPVKAKAEYFL